ncbi:hypothetical protein BaRGS_00037421, partial [Batillaria attramentaria]
PTTTEAPKVCADVYSTCQELIQFAFCDASPDLARNCILVALVGFLGITTGATVRHSDAKCLDMQDDVISKNRACALAQEFVDAGFSCNNTWMETFNGHVTFGDNPYAHVCNAQINGVVYNYNCGPGSYVACPYAPNVAHGSRVCTDTIRLGSTCTTVCSAGYQLYGSQTTTCGSYGQWSHYFAVCQPISCGSPASVTGGQLVCPNGHDYGSSCTVQCHAGYRPSGATSVRCTQSGRWSHADPCYDVQPPQFPNGCPADMDVFSGPLESPVSVVWSDPLTTDNSGAKATVTSQPSSGSVLGLGNHTVTVKATDAMLNEASCSFVVTVKARTCQPLPAVPNGRMTCMRNNVEGSKCTLLCDNGFRRDGQTTLSCLTTGNWDSAVPSCTDVEPPVFVRGCPSNIQVYASPLPYDTMVNWTVPEVTDNSGLAIQLTSDVKPGASFPAGVTSVTYTATDVSGNNSTCQFNVTVTPLTCDAPNFDTTNSSGTQMIFDCPDGYVYGASCTLNCTQGYRLIGEEGITCKRDDSTHPPTMEWSWPGEAPSGKPHCNEDKCPALQPPTNGALSCFLGKLGWDCLMSCDASWEIPFTTSGLFFCLNSVGTWNTQVVPDCVVRVRPTSVRLQTQLFYSVDSCETSPDTFRDNFIERINNSTLKDLCVNVPSCTASNVEVTCGPVVTRKRRAALEDTDADSQEPMATPHILLSYDFRLKYEEGKRLPKETFQYYMRLKDTIFDNVKMHAQSGHLDVDNVPLDKSSIQQPIVHVDCPPGTLYRNENRLSIFSSGCGAGYYLSEVSTQCEACPVGSYTELDNATSCAPCPPGWSTPTTGSKNSSDCKATTHT